MNAILNMLIKSFAFIFSLYCPYMFYTFKKSGFSYFLGYGRLQLSTLKDFLLIVLFHSKILFLFPDQETIHRNHFLVSSSQFKTFLNLDSGDNKVEYIRQHYQQLSENCIYTSEGGGQLKFPIDTVYFSFNNILCS